jgi:hypothetical protein
MLVGGVLWLAWVEWRAADRPWPEDLAQPTSAEELRRLPPGRDFLLSGRVEPLPRASVWEWQGRFVFRHRQRQDLSDSGGKTVRVVTVAEHRPALRWVWDGGAWEVPAESYGIEHAPRIEPRFWPRKWLWTARVDDWDRSSTGFRPGEDALALGRIAADSRPMIAELLPGSLERANAQWQSVERPRFFLILAVKLVLTLGLLLWLLRLPARISSAGRSDGGN